MRILSATHKDLTQEVEAGRFRQDLYYRLNVIELRIPPLREHPGDIQALAAATLARLADSYGGSVPGISDAAMAALQNHSFPGNVRELENVLERAFTLCEDNVITPEDLQLQQDTGQAGASRHSDTRIEVDTEETLSDELPLEPASTRQASDADFALPSDTNLEEYLETIERKLITDALDATRWNKTAAAKELGITFRALRYKLKKLELE